VTEPKKQDGTMELDVGQIDLLDLPLPPRSKPTMEAASPAEEHRVSKGPPPLPPSAPPAAPSEEEPPVPSLALPSPSQPHPPPAGAISARSLAFGPPKKEKSAAVQLLIGMGGATVLCVIAFFAWKATHKAQPVAPAASASASAVPTHAFTMAPIEFTSPASSESAAPEETATASAHASSSAPATTTSTAKPTGTTRGTAAPAGTGKPPRTDELIKVEN
jgi:hypothetical protein